MADRIIEANRLNELNVAELFVLAAGLYGHDWGMAVSQNERQALRAIIEGKPHTDGVLLLVDEQEKLKEFSYNSDVKTIVVLEDDSLWREYVRFTHCERSALKIRNYFQKSEPGVGDAVARVALAHGIDIKDIDKPNAYSSDFSFNGHLLDLKAIAIYVRLVDLLDIAGDRTPYAIWNFVSPRNPRSIMEWKKHRSLNAVTCADYQSARKIVIDGSTNDAEVWAELRDLVRYVEDQVRGCNDLLARSCSRLYHLNLMVVESRISPEGFNPVDIRFEFDRDRTFQILSEEVYNGDCYVFLRELLQNSIDAINLRRSLLERNGISIQGLIKFEVEQQPDGDAIVYCDDNGIGMDEYIVRNYLSVAGRSFYVSKEFERYGLTMDAISRFGIGILSCFMAADEIEIETLRDPNISGNSEPLRIVIPNVSHQFRVFRGSSARLTGTRVKVKVLGKYLKSAPNQWNEKLRVADYLAEIAGFVEIPIVVNEGDLSTVIIHPGQNESSVMKMLGNKGVLKSNVEFRQKGKTYPSDYNFVIQDIQRMTEYFETRFIKISDLWPTDMPCSYEGEISILEPKLEKFHFSFNNYSY